MLFGAAFNHLLAWKTITENQRKRCSIINSLFEFFTEDWLIFPAWELCSIEQLDKPNSQSGNTCMTHIPCSLSFYSDKHIILGQWLVYRRLFELALDSLGNSSIE